jgi:hypothetical protein
MDFSLAKKNAALKQYSEVSRFRGQLGKWPIASDWRFGFYGSLIILAQVCVSDVHSAGRAATD